MFIPATRAHCTGRGFVLFRHFPDDVLPAYFSMARLAPLTLFAFVHVVLLVTVNACFTEGFHFIQADRMTIHAFGSEVFAD
jgi:hypothetical protein